MKRSLRDRHAWKVKTRFLRVEFLQNPWQEKRSAYNDRPSVLFTKEPCEWIGQSLTNMHKDESAIFRVNCLTTLDKSSEMHIITIRQYILQISSPWQIIENWEVSSQRHKPVEQALSLSKGCSLTSRCRKTSVFSSVDVLTGQGGSCTIQPALLPEL